MLRRHFIAAVAATLAVSGAPALQAAPAPFQSPRISVAVEGKGRDVILIHGLAGSPKIWKATTEAVPGYRYHLIQVKGFAGTPAEANASGPVAAPVAAEIARYISSQRLRRPAVVGHSMGGTIGLVLAPSNPNAISKLMVVDQVPFMGALMGQQSPGQAAAMADQFVAQFQGPTPADGQKALVDMLTPMVRDELSRGIVIEDARLSDPGAVRNSLRELFATDLRPDLKYVVAPVTVLYVTPAGMNLTDAQTDAAYRSAYATLKGVKLIRVPDSAHFIMTDNPARFRSELATFLR